MGLGASLFLIAGGAILVWGVNREVAGLDVDAIGVILMVIGIIGAVLSMIFWSSWGGFGGGRRRATYVEEGPPARLLRSVLSGVRLCLAPVALRVRRPGLRQLHLRASPMASPWASALSAGYRADNGSTFAPRTSTSKWRCGPVALAGRADEADRRAACDRSPTLTAIRERCA